MARIVSIVILGLLAASVAGAARSDFPQPRALEPDVTFWKRIYSEVGTDGGLIHDTHDLGLVYEVVKFPSARGADAHTEARKRYYQGILRTLATGKRSGLSRDEQRVLALFGGEATSARLRLAAERIRFQLGQADKFRSGIIRSGAYLDHILANLRDMNLPLEIAHLPHVESSFTPNIYSRTGAAGLWQFMPATGRRFMRVDHIVDERLDPYRASIAAARLLEQNYRVTGSWPLAITAYNHGASGMRRAAQQLGTKDIARIVREYRSPTFGFASRNFYVEFLAANHVASNHEDYFGKLALERPVDYETVTLPFYAKSRDLAKSLGVDVATLEKANPALRPGVWSGGNFVPKGYSLRVPSAALDRPLGEAIAAIPNSSRYASQGGGSSTYVVRRGDTLSKIASRHGLTTKRLASMNGIRRYNQIRVGQRLKLPGQTRMAPMESPAPKEVVVAAARPAPAAEAKKPPVSEARAPEVVASSGDGQATTVETYTVRRGDNLTQIAKRYGLSIAEVAALNGLGNRHQIQAGQKLRIAKATAPDERETPAAIEVARVEKSVPPSPKPAPATPKAASTPPAPKPAAPPAPSPPPTPTAKPAPEPTPVAVASREPERAVPVAAEAWDPDNESATDPSPGLLADPSDYTIGRDGKITVQPNETLGHYAEWLGVRVSRLRQLNGLRYGEPVDVHQRLRLDFSQVPAADFERVRVEYHRELQEEFFAEWEIEGTAVHKVGPGDSIWTLSTRRFAVPIWLLRQYNPDVDLDALSTGTQITVPKLRQRNAETSAREGLVQRATAG
ncbi:MAG: LysM peptidoglycan-binding domain-containing protein [Myxococcota bacterium]